MTKEIQEKNVISIAVRDRMAVLISPRAIVSDNTGYVVRFDFDEEWGAYDTKTVWFVRDDGTCYPPAVIKEEGQCSLPRINGTGHIRIGVTAGDIHTSTAASLTVLPSVLEIGGQVLEADPTAPAAVWDWILEKLRAIEQNSAAQSDWLQNDESAGDYIKNRPFCERTVEKALLTMTGTTVSETELSVTFNWGDLEQLVYDNSVTAIAYGGIRKPCSLLWDEACGEITVVIDGISVGSMLPAANPTKTVVLTAADCVTGTNTAFTEGSYDVYIMGNAVETKRIDTRFLPETVPDFGNIQVRANQLPVKGEGGAIEWKQFSLDTIDQEDYALPEKLTISYTLPLSVGETVSHSLRGYTLVTSALRGDYIVLFGNDDMTNTITVPFLLTRNDVGEKRYWSGVGYGTNYTTGESAGLYVMQAVSEGTGAIPMTITRLM